MKKNAYSFKINFIAVLFASSALYAAPEAPLAEPEIPEEVSILDTSSFSQQKIVPEFSTTAIPLPSPKNSFLAVGLSFLFPGLGHIYLGDITTGFSLAGNAGLGIGGISLAHSQEFIESTGALVASTSWLYGIYAAYRDVRIYNRQTGYRYEMPTDSFLDLTYAPFNLKVLKKPEVWGGLLGSIAVAFSAAYLLSSGEKHISPFCSLTKAISPLRAFPVGIGEEAFFRGFLQSQLSEWLSPWGGILLSSLLFGAAHIPNARGWPPEEQQEYYRAIVPLIGLSGIYDGWLTYKNHSLKESVALHAWYDFFIFTIGVFVPDSIIKVRPEFAFSVPF